jgi:uncharacterized membrane protein
MTRLKLGFITAVIVVGAIAIAVLQWPEAVKNSGFGSGGYNQGLTGTIMLAVLMAGIPIVLFAAATRKRKLRSRPASRSRRPGAPPSANIAIRRIATF